MHANFHAIVHSWGAWKCVRARLKGATLEAAAAAMATRLTVFQVHELWIEVNSRAINRLLMGWQLCARAAGAGIGLELNLKTWTTGNEACTA